MKNMLYQVLVAAVVAGCISTVSGQETLEKKAMQVGDITEAEAAGEKIQKIIFMQDDAQTLIVSKIYELKHTKAADIAPFVRSAVVRYDEASSVGRLEDQTNKRQLLIVSTGEDMIPYIDKMIVALDRPGQMNAFGTVISGTGIAYGTYTPQFRAASDMRDVIVDGDVSSGPLDSVVRLDKKTNMFYFKDTPFRVADIEQKLQWLDKPIPQVRVELKIYEVRDSDLLDVGIDYLAWKNGPGLNLFEAGYEALNIKAAETIFNELAQTGIDLFGNFSYGFGGMYTAPSFDFSFVRILQQNGKAIINSTANLTLSNNPDATFKASFSPEYQNILKDEDHRASVDVGGDASLDALVTNAIITADKDGVLNFTYTLSGSNVVERNNLGTEISETTETSASVTLDFVNEKLLTSWKRVSDVEQTIGVPFLCELPILKYIFGTTTSNAETTHYFITARAVPVLYNEDVKTGIMLEFDEVVKK